MRRKGPATLMLVAACGLVAVHPSFPGSITVSWDPVVGAQGYRVYHSSHWAEPTEPLEVGRVSGVRLDGLEDCVPWRLLVKAFNPAGESAASRVLRGIPAPEIGSLEPPTVVQGGQFTLEISGSNFTPGAEVTLIPESVPKDINGRPLVTLDSHLVIDCHAIEVVLTIEPTIPGGRAMEVGNFLPVLQVVNPDSVFGFDSVALEVLFDPDRLNINGVDGDSAERIDGGDLAWLAFAYASREGETRYDADADLNGDGMVDGVDLAYLASGFGTCWTGSDWSRENCF